MESTMKTFSNICFFSYKLQIQPKKSHPIYTDKYTAVSMSVLCIRSILDYYH